MMDFTSSGKQENFVTKNNDFCSYQIYLDDNDITMMTAEDLRDRCLDIVKKKLGSYLWHRDCFNLGVVFHEDKSKNRMYLSGNVVYGENIDDEWCIVELLLKVSSEISNISICTCDPDGEFLLVEGAEHVPDWIEPGINPTVYYSMT